MDHSYVHYRASAATHSVADTSHCTDPLLKNFNKYNIKEKMKKWQGQEKVSGAGQHPLGSALEVQTLSGRTTSEGEA